MAEKFFQHVAKKNSNNAAMELLDILDYRGPYGVAETTTVGDAKVPIYWVDPKFDIAN